MAGAIGGEGGELWRDCATWLTNFNIIRKDHIANLKESTVKDLAYTLRDGVLLCSLLNTLSPGCIDMKDVNQKPQMAQFLCLRNIKIFLNVCNEIFGLKESELFEPSELFDLSDFLKVLHTLSHLSTCAKVQHINKGGFSIPLENIETEEDIYRTLNASEPSAEAEYSSYDEYSMANEEIYQDLTYRRSMPPDLPKWLNVSNPQCLEKRDHVIKELVETEKNYIDVLSTVQRHFSIPLAKYLTEEENKLIFEHIRSLLHVHTGFHNQLRMAVMHGPSSDGHLGTVFLDWKEQFLLYGDYCANLPKVQATLQDICMKKELFNQEVKKCEEEANKSKFKLRDILSVPMQRILKYHLLLDKLLSETSQTHEDYVNLRSARDAMVDVAQYINEVKRDSDTVKIIKDIQNSISDWSMPENIELKDYGRLLKDGELRIRSHEDSRCKLRYIFVFDQVLLMCKTTRSDQYRYRDSLRLSEFKVEKTNLRRTLHQNSRWSYQWLLVRKSESTAFTMYARTEELKQKWIKALEEAMGNIEPPGSTNLGHHFSMQTFEKPQTCHCCGKYLKGRIFQGYQCDLCTLPVHKSCILEIKQRCGGPNHRTPPELPPRHTPIRPELASPPEHNRNNSTSSSQSNNEVPLAPQIPERSGFGSVSDWPERESLNEYLWFVGEMSRDEASSALQNEPDGTFLLRIRPQGPTAPLETIYALSLKINSRVKHMKVCVRTQDSELQYYLSESRLFRSIEELINCYEHTSLRENYTGLDVTLQWPFHRIRAIAKYDFQPTESNQLLLQQGMHLVITSKEGDHKGWWKGRAEDKVGFFPKEYVEEENTDEST